MTASPKGRRSTPSTDAMVEFEDSVPDVLFESIAPGEPPFWPQVRHHFAFEGEMADIGTDSRAPGGSRPSALESVRLLARAYRPSRRDVAWARGQADVLHLIGGSEYLDPDGRSRNWLTGDYADAATDRTAMLQWSPSAAEPAFRRTWSFGQAELRAAATARLSSYRSRMEPRVRHLVAEYARQMPIDYPDDAVEAIADIVVYAEGLRHSLDRAFCKVLDRLEPKTVLLGQASYGHFTMVVARLRERGIYIAEPQHGWIGPSHGAYNFGAAMRMPGLVESLPDELLTFGSFWSEGLRYPVKQTSIGKPQIDQLAAVARPRAERPQEILVVLSAMERPLVLEFTAALAKAIPAGWTIRVRPHPVERERFDDLYPGMLGGSVTLDTHSDVYESLGSARTVVGLASTVLFEAAGVGCAVFVLASPLAEVYVGDLFGDVVSADRGLDRVLASLDDPDGHGGMAVPIDDVWRPGAVANYLEWLATRD